MENLINQDDLKNLSEKDIQKLKEEYIKNDFADGLYCNNCGNFFFEGEQCPKCGSDEIDIAIELGDYVVVGTDYEDVNNNFGKINDFLFDK